MKKRTVTGEVPSVAKMILCSFARATTVSARMMDTSKNYPRGESAESFPPEYDSDIVTKILRIASAYQLYARIFAWTDEKSSRRSPHDELFRDALSSNSVCFGRKTGTVEVLPSGSRNPQRFKKTRNSQRAARLFFGKKITIHLTVFTGGTVCLADTPQGCFRGIVRLPVRSTAARSSAAWRIRRGTAQPFPPWTRESDSAVPWRRPTYIRPPGPRRSF